MSTFDKVKEILIEQLECDEAKVTESASIVDDLGADSLDFVEIGMELEDAFDVEIEESAYADMNTVADIVSAIDSQL